MLDKLIPKVTVPEGKSGPWTVERFVVSEEDAKWFNLREMFHFTNRQIVPGDYTRLIHDKEWNPVMSDTSAERWDLYDVVKRARGRVLIAGLGLGVVLNAILQKTEVIHITVVEKDSDILALVAPHYQTMADGRLTVVQADIFDWKPKKGERWDVAWFDIWPTICADNLPEMARLKHKFACRTAWKGCWCEQMAKELR